jgi:hypothetical protein
LLHEADSEVYMTNFALNDGGWVNGLLWQAGSRPFHGSGDQLTININDVLGAVVVVFSYTFMLLTNRGELRGR